MKYLQLIIILILAVTPPLHAYNPAVAEPREVLNLNDFEFIKNIDKPGNQKILFKNKTTGKRWMVKGDNSLNGLRSYILGDIYTLVLDKGLVPNLQLLCDGEGNIFVGSEFIDQFHTLAKFPRKSDSWEIRSCFPYNCGDNTFFGAEKIFALAIILGDVDLHVYNLGTVPTDEPDVFKIAKIYHDGVGTCFVEPITLRSLAKVVIGEGQEKTLTGLNFRKLNPYKIADAFEEIAAIPDSVIENTIRNRLKEFTTASCLKASSLQEKMISEMESSIEKDIETILKRKHRCIDFAKSITIEGAVLKGDLNRIKTFIHSGDDVNQNFGYIFIDTQPSLLQGHRLVEIFHQINRGNLALYDEFLDEAANNSPVNILELSIHHNKNRFAKRLLETFPFKAEVIESALELAKTKTNKTVVAHLEKVLQQTLKKEQ